MIVHLTKTHVHIPPTTSALQLLGLRGVLKGYIFTKTQNIWRILSLISITSTQTQKLFYWKTWDTCHLFSGRVSQGNELSACRFSSAPKARPLLSRRRRFHFCANTTVWSNHFHTYNSNLFHSYKSRHSHHFKRFH